MTSYGQTYAQLERDDPRRDTVMTASFLRASLFTSVVAFGVAAFAFGLGLLMVLVGWALLSVDRTLRANLVLGPLWRSSVSSSGTNERQNVSPPSGISGRAGGGPPG